MKRMIALGLSILTLVMLFACPTYANSAQMQWRGVDSTGAMVADKDCPIEVTKEVLTFEIAEFPAEYYHNRPEYLAYEGKVTAEYTFYNPSDYTVTASLVFPFGNQPDYVSIYDEETQSYVSNADTEKYKITVNGEAVEKKIRYTLQNDSFSFRLSNDLPKLKDSYTSDSFYSPAMTVTEYVYQISGLDKEKYHAANVAFDWDGKDGNTKIYFPEQSGFHMQKDGDGRLSMWAKNGDIFSVYAIGVPLTSPLVMKCYQNGGVKDKEEIGGTVTLMKTETQTLEDLIFTHWSESTGVSRVDWYNAAMDAFRYGANEDDKTGVVRLGMLSDLSAESMMGALMRWYEYEITLSPKSSLVNTVTAPIYPARNMEHEPDIFTYTYLLSPASTWADFGELEIVLHTPFYMTESSLDAWSRTDDGYVQKRDGLPSGEMKFTLCSAENPQKPMKTIKDYLPTEWLIVFSVFGGVVLLMGAGVAVVLIFRKRKKKGKNQ